ncbi:MAG: lysophospholipid acyltransferase family protein [Capsulimonadales bacterium]|nr:lysophospholipid acyltransferase family protein [Capsulimonadales bacterium]
MKEPERPRPVSPKNRILARITVGVVRCLCATLRLTIEREAESEALIAQHGGCLFVTWHGRTMIPIDHFRGRGRIGYHTLVSLSRDGDFLAAYLAACGLKVIRGSTNRRGAAAAREVLNLLDKGGVLAFTPDGPRGPAGVAQPGVVYFALKSGKPIIPAGIAAWPRWETDSWDRFLIPRPFARARWIFGEPIFIREGEDWTAAAARVTEAINRLQAAAEEKVRSETRYRHGPERPVSVPPGNRQDRAGRIGGDGAG